MVHLITYRESDLKNEVARKYCGQICSERFLPVIGESGKKTVREHGSALSSQSQGIWGYLPVMWKASYARLQPVSSETVGPVTFSHWFPRALERNWITTPCCQLLLLCFLAACQGIWALASHLRSGSMQKASSYCAAHLPTPGSSPIHELCFLLFITWSPACNSMLITSSVARRIILHLVTGLFRVPTFSKALVFRRSNIHWITFKLW